MKKQWIACLAVALVVALGTTSAVAQRGGGGGGAGGNGGGGGKSNSSNQNGTKNQKIADASDAELQDLTSRLTLTDPQKAAVKSVLDGRDTQLESLKKEKLPKDETKEKSAEIKDTANAKIRTFLTPRQQTIFDSTTKKKGGKKNKDEAPDTTPAATAPSTAPPPLASSAAPAPQTP